MWSVEWTLFIISNTGNEMPHWVANTRKRCREELASLRAQCGGKLPNGVGFRIVKTWEVKRA